MSKLNTRKERDCFCLWSNQCNFLNPMLNHIWNIECMKGHGLLEYFKIKISLLI